MEKNMENVMESRVRYLLELHVDGLDSEGQPSKHKHGFSSMCIAISHGLFARGPIIALGATVVVIR